MWHTPTTTASKQYEKRYPSGGVRKHPIPNLNAEVEEGIPYSEQVKNRKMYPTPTCQENEHPDAKLNANGRRLTKDGTNSHSLNLADTVRMFPTPTCQEAEGGIVKNVEEHNGSFSRKNKAGEVGQLNPDWVEWLMGWPVGWTDLKPMSIEAFNEWMESVLDGSYWENDLADVGEVGRVTTVKTDRSDRLKAIGNGQVALCASAAWDLLNMDRLRQTE